MTSFQYIFKRIFNVKNYYGKGAIFRVAQKESGLKSK